MTDQTDQTTEQAKMEEAQATIFTTWAVFRLPDEMVEQGQPLACPLESCPAPEFIGYWRDEGESGYYGGGRRAIRAVATTTGRYIAAEVHTTDDDTYRHPGCRVSLEVID